MSAIDELHPAQFAAVHIDPVLDDDDRMIGGHFPQSGLDHGQVVRVGDRMPALPDQLGLRLSKQLAIDFVHEGEGAIRQKPADHLGLILDHRAKAVLRRRRRSHSSCLPDERRRVCGQQIQQALHLGIGPVGPAVMRGQHSQHLS